MNALLDEVAGNFDGTLSGLPADHEDAPEYAEAQRMLQFLQFFVSIQDDSFIANNSIIREFIGGSILVD